MLISIAERCSVRRNNSRSVLLQLTKYKKAGLWSPALLISYIVCLNTECCFHNLFLLLFVNFCITGSSRSRWLTTDNTVVNAL